MDSIGIVIIGQNEGQRLLECIASARGASDRIVYVDSASADGSPAAAGRMGCEVIELDPARPFTAARARNEGFRRLLDLWPDTANVQFVDGDCVLAADWPARAGLELERDPGLALVCGHLRERAPRESIYNRLCALEWKAAAGEIDSCGGIFMIRACAFDSVGGFDPSMRGGEEPELCLRLRRAGWRLRRIDVEMATHDAAMHTLRQWLGRTVRSGCAFAHCAALHGRKGHPAWRRAMRSNFLWGAAIPATTLACLAASLWAAPLAWASLLGPIACVLQTARIWARRRATGDSSSDAALYAVFCMLSKPPQCVGMLWCWLAMRGKPRTGACTAPPTSLRREHADAC